MGGDLRAPYFLGGCYSGFFIWCACSSGCCAPCACSTGFLTPCACSSMQDLAHRQQQLEAKVAEAHVAPPVPLHRQPFQMPAAKGPPVPGLSPFTTSLGPPPKIRNLLALCPLSRPIPWVSRVLLHHLWPRLPMPPWP